MSDLEKPKASPIQNLNALRHRLEEIVKLQPSTEDIEKQNLDALEQGRQHIQNELFDMMQNSPLFKSLEEKTGLEKEALQQIYASLSEIRAHSLADKAENIQQAWNRLFQLNRDLERTLVMVKLLLAADKDQLETMPETEVIRGRIRSTLGANPFDERPLP